ncbi:hypothetical protein SmJEL517_g02915 [Synchytrium microbalum]|uniref:Major facilitator superfamily (MFS) profile domain-containing protein n=1 Tax=Synchytrium microbalum TaxID=1806994 RepID=A0A507C4Z6_9FUNG|nr:uncharacterized protein SmJEL517_g02915 [Synchytrium microbalum]TPX34458.1 hypothetical protein SmJEL517_g02915 [Synchytrium microbalum]
MAEMQLETILEYQLRVIAVKGAALKYDVDQEEQEEQARLAAIAALEKGVQVPEPQPNDNVAQPYSVKPPTTTQQPSPPRKITMTSAQKYITIMAIMAANLLFTLVSSSAPVSNQAVSKELKAGSQFVWVSVAFLPTAGGLQPILPTLSAILGTRNLCVLSGLVWIFGNLLSALATNFPIFCLGRGLAGAAFGGCMLLPYLILIKIAPSKDEITRLFAIMSVCSNIGNFTGPIIAGALISQVGWRSVYYWSLPVVLCIIMPGFAIGLHNTNIDGDISQLKSAQATANDWIQKPLAKFIAFVRKLTTLDWLGTGVTIAFALCVQMVFSYTSPIFGWTSAITVGLCAGSVSLFLLLVLVELNVAKNPIIPKQVFAYRNYNTSFIYLQGMRGIFGAAFVFLPIFVQIVRNNNVLVSGLLVAPMATGVILGSAVANAIAKKDGYLQFLMVIAGVLGTIGLGCFTLLHPSSSDVSIAFVGIVIGLGLGVSSITNFVYTVILPKQLTHGGASAAGGLATCFTGVLLSIMSSVMSRTAQSGFGNLMANPTYSAQLALYPVIPYDSIPDLPQPLRDQAVQIWANATTSTFLYMMVCSAVCCVSAMAMKNVGEKKGDERKAWSISLRIWKFITCS